MKDRKWWFNMTKNYENLSTILSFFQGTLRPDLIESASSMTSGSADTIKTHHNDTQLVRELQKVQKIFKNSKKNQNFH